VSQAEGASIIAESNLNSEPTNLKPKLKKRAGVHEFISAWEGSRDKKLISSHDRRIHSTMEHRSDYSSSKAISINKAGVPSLRNAAIRKSTQLDPLR